MIRWCLALLLLVSLNYPIDAGAFESSTVKLQDIRTVQVAVLSDGESERSESELAFLKQLIRKELAGEFEVEFPDSLRAAGNWTEASIRSELESLLGSAHVDVCIATGPIGSQLVSQLETRPFPCLGLAVIDAEVQGIPRRSTGSGTPNLSYLSGRLKLKRDLERFSELVEFESCAIIMAPEFKQAIPDLANELVTGFEKLGVAARLELLKSSIELTVEALGKDVDAVFVVGQGRLETTLIDALAEALIEKGLPAFGLISRSSVEAGLLAALVPAEGQFARLNKAAAHLAKLLRGERAETLSTKLNFIDELKINADTAAALGIKPQFDVLSEAVLVGAQEQASEVHWSLSKVMNEALFLDLNLQAADQALLAGHENLAQARSKLLPQFDLSASWSVIDENQASLGRAERTLSGSLRGSQVLYAESLWAQIDVEQDLYSSRQSDLEVQRLDVMQTAADAYLNVLRAQSLARIQSEDLRLSRSNLELAEVQFDIGSSGPADVYRWQSRIAIGRRDVLKARANVQVAVIELNRILRQPLDQNLSIPVIDGDGAGVLVDARLEQYVDNPFDYETFLDFQVADGFKSSPELTSLDGAIRAQSRALMSARRSHWQPVFSLDGSLTDVFDTGGEGSGDLGAFASFIPDPESTVWNAALVGSFELYTGGAKRSRERQARHELVRLRYQREALTQLVEQRIRAALQLASASFAGIGLSSEAATAAELSLALVTDAYSAGLGSIVEVLEAQTAAEVARESVVAAEFDYAIDMIGVQRAVGHFDLFQVGAAREDWFGKLEDFEATRTSSVRK